MPPIPDIESLSNKELSELLKEYDVTTGPIVGSTRKIYEKKLMERITGEEIRSKYKPVPHDESDDEDVPPSPAYKQYEQERSEARRRGLRSDTAEDAEPLNESYRRSPRLHKTPMRFTSTPLPNKTDGKVTSSKNTTSKGIPLWIKILAVLIAIVIGYLIYQNMEASDDNNVPRGIEAEV